MPDDEFGFNDLGAAKEARQDAKAKRKEKEDA